MDHLDAMILRELAYRPADPHHAARGLRRPWDAARALGLHGTTVKRRIADMREQNVLLGVHLQPAGALVGRRTSEHRLRYTTAAAKRRALDHLAADPAAWELYGSVCNDIVLVLATPQEEDIRAHAQRLAQETGADYRFHHVRDWSVPVDRVSALDLRILAAFADDALRPIADAAAEVGVAAKTITTRMRALTSARAFIVHPALDYRRINGGITAYLDLDLEVGASERAHVELANRFPTAICRSTSGSENGYLVVHVEGSTDIEEVLLRAESIPGVRSMEMRVLNEMRAEPARWKDALLARAEALARAKGVWSAPWRATPASIAASR